MPTGIWTARRRRRVRRRRRQRRRRRRRRRWRTALIKSNNPHLAGGEQRTKETKKERNKEPKKQTNKETKKQRNTETKKHRNINTNKHTHKLTHTQTNTHKQTKKQTNERTNKQTHTHTDKQASKQANTQTFRFYLQVSCHRHLPGPHLPKGPFLQACFVGVALDPSQGVPESSKFWENMLGLIGTEYHGDIYVYMYEHVDV